MSQNKTDIAINKINAMQDNGTSEEEILSWVDKQPNADDIYAAYQEMVKQLIVKK